MRRSTISLLLLATAAATAAITAAGCGFGRADDTGLPVPGHHWGWVCPSGDAPDGDAGCPSAEAGASDAPGDGGTLADGPPADR
jgi:hypothetical protein